jgi:hypothetical protein
MGLRAYLLLDRTLERDDIYIFTQRSTDQYLMRKILKGKIPKRKDSSGYRY